MAKQQSDENQYGLKRYIEGPIKRQIRQECGFGCVVCGNAIAEYEHIDPTFENALEHDPSKMALLCGLCHSRVTRGTWSKDKIKKARANPKTFIDGVSKDAFDIDAPFTLRIGNNIFENTRTFLQLTNYLTGGLPETERLVYLDPPEEPGAPVRLSGKFFDSQGNPILTVEENEIIIRNTPWDVEIVGPELTIREGSRQIAYQHVVDPPHGVTITRLNMTYHGINISVNPQQDLIITSPTGDKYRIRNMKIVNPYTAINLNLR